MDLTHRLPGLKDTIAAADRLLEQDGVIEVDLPTAEQLVSEPPIQPLGRCGPYQIGRRLRLVPAAVGTAAARPGHGPCRHR